MMYSTNYHSFWNSIVKDLDIAMRFYEFVKLNLVAFLLIFTVQFEERSRVECTKSIKVDSS